MDLRVLRYVTCLADELHFGRAARACHISAQPFGQAVHRLERELGYRLFECTSRRVLLTPAGARFVVEAQAILARIDGLTKLVGAEEETGRRPDEVIVGTLGFGLAERWRPLRQLVFDQQPELVIGHRTLDMQAPYDAVRLGEVDVGVVMDLGPVEGLMFDRVLSMAPVAVVPVESDLADAHWLHIGDLEGRPSSLIPTPPSWLAAWSEYGRDPTAKGLVVADPAMLPAVVATPGRVGLHLEAASRYFPHPDVRFVPIDGPRAVIAIATREGDDRPEVRAFRQAARVLAQF